MTQAPSPASPATVGTAVIEARDLSKRFGAVVALDHVGFTVEPGEVCGMLGPNGAGKTTALRALLGLIRPTGGQAFLLGQPVRPGMSALRRVGALIEGAAFVPQLSGIANLRLWWEEGGERWADAAVDDALSIAGLGDAVERRVKTYSHGMRQRLGIARALLGRPDVLVLDEPTTGLDPQEIREVRLLVRRLSDRGATILLSSHLLSEVEQTCSHVVVLDRGGLVAAGSVADIVGSAERSVHLEVSDPEAASRILDQLPGVRAVHAEAIGFTVELDGTSSEELVAALVHAGVGVRTVVARRQLEDAFLSILGEVHRG